MTSKKPKKPKKQVKLSDVIIPKFQPLVNDTKHMHKTITSGRAGTKSSFSGLDAIFTIVKPKKAAVVVMRKFHNKLRKTVYKECIRAIGRLGLSKKQFKISVSPMQITYKKNGNTIYFTGSDSIDDTKGMIDEERPIVMVIIDELTEFFDKGEGEDEIQNIIATFVRGNDDNFQMLYLFNPPKNPKAPVNLWVKKMEERADCIHIHVDYRDVPVEWLGKKLIEEAEAMKLHDPKMYEWIWLGLAIGLDDIIYYMFDEMKHVYKDGELETNPSYFIIGVDYGQMNATTYQAFSLDFNQKKLIGLDEFYHSGRDSGKQKTPAEYAQEMRKLLDGLYKCYGRKGAYIYIDPSAKGLAEEIKRVCPEAKVRGAQNDVKLGISRAQKLLSFNVLAFNENQVMLNDEICTYAYDEKSIERGNETPVKINDHCMDAMRYGVMGSWKWLRKLLPFLNDGKEVETDE